MDAVLAEFSKLAEIPRKSGHEKAVSDYLYGFAKQLGLAAQQDDAYNIIIDKPAAKGLENAPLTILQSHMDMVCVAKEGLQYNPLTDAIKLINDGEFLRADGTSLGADDGIGIAAALYILKADFAHGPIRVIITADEESGMTGAMAMDAKHLDADYLINCDSEDLNVITVSSAGSLNVDLRREIKWQKPSTSDAYKIAIKGLVGGHSGSEIHQGRANAIKLLGTMLNLMGDVGINFEVASINGGQARNVIASSAECVVSVGPMDTYRMNNVIAKMNKFVSDIYGGVERSYFIEFKPAGKIGEVMDKGTVRAVIDYILLVHDGVIKMSPQDASLVETSSNLGVIKTEESEVVMQSFPRSNIDAKLSEIKLYQTRLAELCGLKVSFGAQSPGWPFRKDSVLAKLAKDALKERGIDASVEAIHAGLECSWFYQKNSHLDMISVGPTVTDVHSPSEKIELKTIEPHVNMLMDVLKKIAE